MQIYTKQNIIDNMNLFIKKYGREPASYDFLSKHNLPNKKTIERRFGGLRKLREELGLYIDHRTGKKRGDLANDINKRAVKWNGIIYKELRKYFEEPFIHKESSIFDDRRNRTDFKVYGSKTFLVDVFYPKDRYSLQGCVLLKQKKYPSDLRKYLDKNFDKVIFLNLNKDVENNVNVQGDFQLMNLEEFWQYCKSMV